jgi:hypothetical protein
VRVTGQALRNERLRAGGHAAALAEVVPATLGNGVDQWYARREAVVATIDRLRSPPPDPPRVRAMDDLEGGS